MSAPVKARGNGPASPSQTIGPFFGFALPWPAGPAVVPEGTAGAIQLRGRLLDGNGDAVPDGLIESWQADAAGRFPATADADGFRGFGRCPTDHDGSFTIVTLKPGGVRDAAGRLHAPHILLRVFARGLLRRLVTRVYFPDEEAANRTDPILSGVADAADRATLIAAPMDGEGGYRFDIRLQGEGETVFFDV